MTTTTEPAVAVPEAKDNRGRIRMIIRWAARVTSIPIFGLVMTSLLPALASFAISAKDDRIIAIGLCGTCLGLLLGWKWAGIGGGIILAGVAVQLSQGDSLLYPDPFSVAFGLQGVLFLISGIVNSTNQSAAVPALRWGRWAAVGVLLVCTLAGAAAILRGPGPAAVPREMGGFVGVWGNGAGFVIEITAAGHAKVTEAKDAKIDAWNSPISPGTSAEFFAYFRGSDRLELAAGPFTGSKVYHVDRAPAGKGKQMVLNGSNPYKQGGGVVLTRQTGH